MERKPPTPVGKSFQLCRQIVLDMYTKEHVLVGATHEVVALQFPTTVDLSVYARLTSAHGAYELELQLQNMDGDVLWREVEGPPLECHDPLLIGIITLHHKQIFIPSPGKYDVVMLANGEEIVRDVLWAHLGKRVSTPPDSEPR